MGLEFVSITEASAEKGCSRPAIWLAIRRGELIARKVGPVWCIEKGPIYRRWAPDPVAQKRGRESQGVGV